MFHSAAQTEPGCQRDAPRGPWRRVAQIHDYQSETAPLNQQIGCFQSVLGIMPTAHPKQAPQLHAGIGGRVGREGIIGIH
jgi:hypothetical protein